VNFKSNLFRTDFYSKESHNVSIGDTAGIGSLNPRNKYLKCDYCELVFHFTTSVVCAQICSAGLWLQDKPTAVPLGSEPKTPRTGLRQL
jgi:hypothetical protein